MTQRANGAARSIEPLEPSLWFERFRAVGARVGSGEGYAPAQLLRHVFHLTQLTPAPLAHIFGAKVCEAAFEQLLDLQHYDCAALLMLGQGVDFAVTRSEDGAIVTAIMSLGPRQPASTVRSGSLCHAVLAAYCACIGSLASRSPSKRRAIGQDRQTTRSAPHRLSLTH